MWSSIVKPDEDVFEERVSDKDTLTTIPVVSGYHLRFKREISLFIEEYKDALDNLYNKHFKEYGHISKKDFYIFAYVNTNERYRR
jgi:hypothetical protein